ncbi:phosphopyruvate hydratase [Nocardia nova]|uniref:phosphopyruvate hydratase n=1 Tax=Nocardia nova TaxID=37330 RepID=UPI0037B3148C
MRLALLTAVEVLDSRGNPTLRVRATLSDGRVVSAGVPSGASTGSREAVELRDHNPARYSGLGVSEAVDNVNGPIADALVGHVFGSFEKVDHLLTELDGTPNLANLGANAVVGVSLATARAFAMHAGQRLWQFLTPDGVEPRLPVPHFNVINGGAHARNALDFQEFMIAPLGAPSMAEAVRAGAEIYRQLRANLTDRGLATGLGDEGGFAPDITTPEQALTLLTEAITDSGYTTGPDGVMIALDPAASEFQHQDRYHVGGQHLSATEMIERYAEMIDRFPIWSIEDGLGENDSAGWQRLTATLGDRVQLVGDDNFVTNAELISAAAVCGIANAALIKVNQVGTVTGTLEALRTCREADYGAMISHRSGETDDAFIADLAVGSGCGQIKSGAPARGERVAKYNRLTEIAATTRPGLPYGLPPELRHRPKGPSL